MSVVASIIFDLGNTLIDYHSGPLTDDEKDLVGLHRMHRVLARRFPDLTFEQLHRDFYGPWMQALSHRSKKKQEYDLRLFLGNVLPLAHLNQQQYRRAVLAFHSPFIETARAASGSIEVLSEFSKSGIALAVLANSPIPGFCHDATLERVGLLPFLKARVYSYDVDLRKPDMRVFQLLLTQIGAQPASTVMVGDSDRLDLIPAKNLGIRAIKFDIRTEHKPGVSNWTQLSTLSDLAASLTESQSK